MHDGRTQLTSHQRAHPAVRPNGRQAIPVAVAERRTQTADRHIMMLGPILRRSDRPVLDRFVIHMLYGTIDPISAAMSDRTDEQFHQADALVGWIGHVEEGTAITAWVLAAAV